MRKPIHTRWRKIRVIESGSFSSFDELFVFLEMADVRLTIKFNDFIWMLSIYMFFVEGFALRPSNYLQSLEYAVDIQVSYSSIYVHSSYEHQRLFHITTVGLPYYGTHRCRILCDVGLPTYSAQPESVDLEKTIPMLRALSLTYLKHNREYAMMMTSLISPIVGK